MGETQKRRSGAIIVSLAARAKALDRSDSGHHTMAHLLENIGGNDVKFGDGELKQFNQELAAITIKGLRLPQAVLNFSNVEAPAKR